MKGIVRISKCFSASLIFSSLILFFGCTTGDSQHRTITYKATRQKFTITVEAEGVIEAQRSHVLVAPRIWPHRPEVSYLALEGSFVKKGELVVALASDKFEADLENALRELAIAQSEVKKTEAEQNRQRSQLGAQIKSAEATAVSARLQLARLEFVAPREREIKKLEIARSEKQAEKSRKKLVFLEAVQKEERTQKILRVRQAENKADMARRNLEQLTLRAPVDGFVVYERNRRTGEKVQEGDELYSGMSIVEIPDISVLQVQLLLSETEVQRLKEGQPATVTISSLGGLRLPGHVSQISKVARRVRRGSRVKTVETTVVIDTTASGLVPGLTALCSIGTEEVPDAVVIPLDTVFEKDSLHLVYVRQQRYFKPREVILGPKGADFAVVDSGLVGGEELALGEPAPSQLR